MLRSLFIFMLTAYSVVSYGQGSTSSHPTSKIPEPLYLLNSNTIANGLVTHLDPKDFKSVVVYKGQDGPGQLKNISSSGIIDISYDKPFNSKSLAEISAQQGVNGPVVFVLNGNKLSATQLATLRIASEAIGQLQVTQATSVKPEATVTIQTVASKANDQGNVRTNATNERRVMIR